VHLFHRLHAAHLIRVRSNAGTLSTSIIFLVSQYCRQLRLAYNEPVFVAICCAVAVTFGYLYTMSTKKRPPKHVLKSSKLASFA